MENKSPENIRGNVSLKEYSTFKIGGPARYFVRVKELVEIEEALDFAIANKLPVFVIGRGSNLLISDGGFDGLVLKIEDNKVKIEEIEDGIEAIVGSGMSLTKLALDLQKAGIGGLEWSAGIPATVGGAVSNNAGAHGHDMSENVKTMIVMEMKLNPEGKYLENYEVRELLKDEAEFSYRSSIFKKHKNFIILNVTFSLKKGDAEKIQNEINENMKSRAEKQPLEYPNIGSIFKNPSLSDEEMEKLFQKCPEAKKLFKNNIIPAGWLIEQTELKGKQIGGAMVSLKHANFIVNIGDAKAEDVIILISLIKQKVRTRFNIQLHEEIEYVGF